MSCLRFYICGLLSWFAGWRPALVLLPMVSRPAGRPIIGNLANIQFHRMFKGRRDRGSNFQSSGAMELIQHTGGKHAYQSPRDRA
jgi:hypothetical protein